MDLALVDASPNGYRHLGLPSPLVHPNATRAELRARLEAYEHAHGAPSFAVHGLEALPAGRARELTHTYLGLRHRYLGVHIDHLDVGAHLGPLLGEATLYRSLWPEMHHRDQILQIGDPAELARHADDLYELPRGHSRPRDLRAAGSIRITRCVGHRRCIAATVTKWSAKAATAARRGTTRYAARLRVPLPAAVLHCGTTPERTQWVRHLVNYPSSNLTPGPASGTSARSAAIRRSLRPVVGDRLGRYALVNRDELFAEAFMVAAAGCDPELRRRWVHRIRPLLADAGIARR